MVANRQFLVGGVCLIIPDILAIEACGTLENLRDKRSRFAPSIHSMLAVCPVPWLLAPAMPGDPTPRWEAIGVFLRAPVFPAVIPVRQPRVLYLLKRDDYLRFKRHDLAQPHEYFAPMEALIDANGDDPELHALLQRASGAANFLGGLPTAISRRPTVPLRSRRDHAPRQVRPIGYQTVNPPADQPLHVAGIIHRPGNDL